MPSTPSQKNDLLEAVRVGFYGGSNFAVPLSIYNLVSPSGLSSPDISDDPLPRCCCTHNVAQCCGARTRMRWGFITGTVRTASPNGVSTRERSPRRALFRSLVLAQCVVPLWVSHDQVSSDIIVSHRIRKMY